MASSDSRCPSGGITVGAEAAPQVINKVVIRIARSKDICCRQGGAGRRGVTVIPRSGNRPLVVAGGLVMVSFWAPARDCGSQKTTSVLRMVWYFRCSIEMVFRQGPRRVTTNEVEKQRDSDGYRRPGQSSGKEHMASPLIKRTFGEHWAGLDYLLLD